MLDRLEAAEHVRGRKRSNKWFWIELRLMINNTAASVLSRGASAESVTSLWIPGVLSCSRNSELSEDENKQLTCAN